MALIKYRYRIDVSTCEYRFKEVHVCWL